MSWQLQLLTQYYNRFFYDAPIEGVRVRTIAFPSTGELYRSHKRSLFKAATFRCTGSLDCKNVVLVFAEGTELAAPRTLFRGRLIDLYNYGILIDEIPMISKWDDTNKDYVAKWAPSQPLPFRQLLVSYAAPPPSLDTASTAVLQYSYMVIIIE
jgi:hypothetical protein